MERAAETGTPVELTSHRTESSSVFANPSGTFTEERHSVPQRVRKQGRLLDIDPTLQAAENGTLSAKATAVGIEFSGGGKGPLVTVTRDGRSLSLSWPGELPKPTVAGDTATYPNVLPDVDLKLRAGNDGFGQLLVVKTPKAAANPDLKSIQYGMTTDGVDVSTDAHGNISAVNPAGQQVFAGPTPRMWDSSSTKTNTQAFAAVPRSATKASEEPQNQVPQDEFLPRPGAKESALGVAVSGKNLALKPDTDVLAGKGTQYPVYIDPYISGSRLAWTIAYKKYPNSTFYNGAGWIERDGKKGTSTARVGYENETNGLGRSFFSMSTRNLWGKEVIKSTFRIKNTWSWSCEKRETQLWDTGSISSSTSWNNQPSWQRKVAHTTESRGWGGNCPAGNLAFDVTSAAKDAVKNKWAQWTLGLRAANESDVYGWKKFDAKSAVLSTEYNTPPNAPTNLDTSPSTRVNGSCSPSNGGYVTLGNTDVALTAKISDPDGGTLKARFIVWPTGGSGFVLDKTISVTSGTIARVAIPKATFQNKDGVTFSWQVQAQDGRTTSAWTPNPPCRFRVDTTRPSTPPDIASDQYPDGSNGWPTKTGIARTPGTFALSSGGVKDVQKYEYFTEWDATVRTATPASAGGSASVKLTPMAAGPHMLYARSLDKANNRSDLAAYLFYVNSSGEKDAPGDLNGDGHPDMYAVTKDGELQLFNGLGDGRLGPKAKASDRSFKDSLITHRGDWTGDGYEDLIEHRYDPVDKTKKLYVHPNEGHGHLSGNTAPMELRLYDQANNHWQKADQILAVGDLDGPTDLDGDGVIGDYDLPSYPDLLVREGKLVWLYFGSASGYLDENPDQPPLLLNAHNTEGIDLFAPGDFDHDGHADLGVRSLDNGAVGVYRGAALYGTAPGNPVLVGQGFTLDKTPLMTSPGDADHDGKFDVWLVTNDGTLWCYPGNEVLRFRVGEGWKDYRAIS
ncbi:FG-GAP-like repeat-containing protein [Streptomyces sp. S186]|uniref:FG-GAP-like repeat-containing protein n=1 Tax=Streptomyces sp. S186 TaxID=3434395 RepID=UPI003F66170B